MTKKLNLALIGAGGIGQLWAQAAKRVKDINLCAVVDINPDAAFQVAKQFKNCLAETNWRKIISSKKIEAVLVATPHKFLASISRTALENKKHVLCEKPAGISSSEIENNSLLVKKNIPVYMIGFNHRYHAAFLKAKELFDKGIIGKILFVRARYGFGGRPGYEKEWRFHKAISGGGELLDQGVHMIDMVRWFAGDLTKVKGFVKDLFWKNDVEDNAFVLLESRSGALASVHVSWSNWNWIHCFEIFGEKGYLIIEGLDQRYRGPERLVVGRRHPEFLKPPVEKTFVFKNEQKNTSLERELREFVSAIKEKRLPVPSGKDAYEVLKIVEKVYAQN